MEMSKLVQSTPGSVIRRLFNAADGMDDAISFSIGEPSFTAPTPVIEDAVKWLRMEKTHYTDNAGLKELREAVAEYHANDLNPNPNGEVLITCGATEAIQLALFALVNPGEEVILVTPAWPNYFGQISMCGAVLKAVIAKEENDFVPTVEDIEAAITEKTRLIILTSPSNPTGAVIDYETNKRLAELICKHNLYVISDEIYSRFVYTEEPYTSITSFEGIRERAVYVSGVSKMLAMPGWRIGYAISTPEIIAGMKKMHENGVSCLPEPLQRSAAYALKNCQADIEYMRKEYLERRDLICEMINAVPGMSVKVPKGAFYAMVNVKELMRRTGLDTEPLAMEILKNTHVITVPASGFGPGGDGYLRMSYATSKEGIQEGLSRIHKYVDSLNLF